MELNSCLVTKLNADTKNNSIMKLNHIRGYYSRPTSGWPSITIVNGEKVKLDDMNGHTTTITGNGTQKAFEFNVVAAGESIAVDISNILDVINLDSPFFGYNIGEFWSYRTEATQVTVGNGLASGTIEDLGKLTSLISLNIMSANNIVGEVKNLAVKQVENERASGVLSIYFGSQTKITYNGVKPTTNPIKIKFGSSMTNPTETDTANGYQVTY